VHRLEDSLVDQLPGHATAGRNTSPSCGAASVGLLPLDHSHTRPSANWATDFRLSLGGETRMKLRGALQALEAFLRIGGLRLASPSMRAYSSAVVPTRSDSYSTSAAEPSLREWARRRLAAVVRSVLWSAPSLPARS